MNVTVSQYLQKVGEVNETTQQFGLPLFAVGRRTTEKL